MVGGGEWGLYQVGMLEMETRLPRVALSPDGQASKQMCASLWRSFSYSK